MDFSEIPVLTTREEAQQILKDHHDDYPASLDVIIEQFTKLQNRSQILLTVATIALTVTGFSGSKIAATGSIPRLLIVTGLLFVLSGIIVLLCQTLTLKWATQIRLPSQEETLEAILVHRNKKTHTYGVALILVVTGLSLFVSSIGFYLLCGKII
jgi:uncharacterized protein YjeT (DUF2065 family)